MKLTGILLGVVLAGAAAGLRANDEELAELQALRLRHRGTVAEWDAQQRAAHADNPDILLRPGLTADRATGTVTFFAEATGLATVDPIEFFIIGEDSGHDYEAVAVALVRPGHVYEGLRFIGLPEGRGVNPRALQFWPKGERVIVTLAGIRMETLILNRDQGAPLPPSGLVFTGSRWIENAEGERVLAADAVSPFSIAANYNESNSVLDVPWQAAQQAVYQRQTLNPERTFEAGALVTVEIHPEYRDGRLRVLDLEMTLLPPDPESDPGTMRAELRCAAAPELDGIRSLAAAFEQFEQLVATGRDPFVALRYHPDLSLGSLQQLAMVLNTIDAEKGIRIEAPPEGDLYYKAFNPHPEHLNRERRLSHPWELAIGPVNPDNGERALTLTWIEQHWPEDGGITPELTEHTVPIASPGDLAQALTTHDTSLPVLLVQVPAALAYGQLMAIIRPVMADYPMIHVFVQP